MQVDNSKKETIRKEILRCDFCGFTFKREEHPSVVYCGPHRLSDGSYTPARRMKAEPIEDTKMKRYLGDGVYVEFDGCAFVLTTEDGIRTTNVIVLEPEVLMELNKFRNELGHEAEGR